MFKNLLFVIFCMSAVSVYSQDIHFSQYMTQPLLLNPAMTGFNECDYRVGALFKSQWNSISEGNTYRTSNVFADFALFKTTKSSNFLGAGISFYSDQAGDLNYNTNKVDVSLAYHMILDKHTKQSFSVGLQGGFAHRSIDQSKAIFQYDAITGEPVLSNTEALSPDALLYGDVGLGLLYSIAPKPRSSYYAGFALQHLNQPNVSGLFTQNLNERQHLKITGHFGSSIPVSQQIYLQPGFLFLKQGASTELTLSNYIKYRFGNEADRNTSIAFGTMYRVADALIFAFRAKVYGFDINLSYDTNISKLSPTTRFNGGPEFGLTYTGCVKRKIKQGYCPDF